MKFLREYLPSFLVGIILLLVSALIYVVQDRDIRRIDGDVAEITSKLERVYNRPADPKEAREVVLNEFLRQRRVQSESALLEKFAEALFLAAIMIIAVEAVTRARENLEHAKSRKELIDEFKVQAGEVSRNVWTAIFGRLVPSQVAAEMTNILKADVCRLNPTYTIVLTREGYTDIPTDKIIQKRQLFYRLLNLTGAPLKYSIPMQVRDYIGALELTAESGEKVKMPRISRLSINGEDVEIHGSELSVSNVIELPQMSSAEDAWEIYSEVDGLALLDDRALYALSAPCVGLEVRVINQLTDIVKTPVDDDVYLTTGFERLRQETPLTWTYKGAILPGTAVSVSWKSKGKTAPPLPNAH